MNRTVLDTDTLSAIMKQNRIASARAKAYLAVHAQLTISIITRFEILRGLYAKGATTQLTAFSALCQRLEILTISDAVVDRAARIYGALYQSGKVIGDADILIAATCLEHGCNIVTNNTAHFSRIQGLVVENWMSPQIP